MLWCHILLADFKVRVDSEVSSLCLTGVSCQKKHHAILRLVYHDSFGEYSMALLSFRVTVVGNGATYIG